jgi:hypothetical protein
MAIKTARNDNSLIDTLGSKLDLAGGKILQIVRATDSTSRSTTSTSFVDASISVTITPQKSDSAILLIWAFNAQDPTTAETLQAQITDNSNNAISGAENAFFGIVSTVSSRAAGVLIAYSTPATANATTYKGRFRVASGTGSIRNDNYTGQLFAIEVSA